MAVRRRLGNLAQMLLDKHLQTQQQESIAKLRHGLDLELQGVRNQDQRNATLRDRAVKDPAFARKLANDGLAEVIGFEPSASDLTSPISEDISAS